MFPLVDSEASVHIFNNSRMSRRYVSDSLTLTHHWWAEPPAYLRCSRATVAHGGTTALAGKASRRPSRCSTAAARSGTEGTAPGPAPAGPEGSRGPEAAWDRSADTWGFKRTHNRRLNAPSRRRSDRPPRTRRRPADGTRPAGTDLTDAQLVTMVTAGRAHRSLRTQRGKVGGCYGYHRG